ncbi:globin [Roseimaritima ulvae]|uniref:Globin domain-containing protein n=1 Tax=Roseimaritima ulvae TaxID=980254 RepID=A0A5B9QX39_9BACT|nr:globin [Roseimaritima ulvae]QEG43624.1 hypothetical protein UC8_56750 [Roseimaritima ulvae]
MIPDDLDPVTASYHRCMYGEGFLDTFYDTFLDGAPDIQEKFRNTDFTHQKLMLRESLLLMIMYSLGQTQVRDELVQLAKRHDRNHVDIPPTMYERWLESLCVAVGKHDPEFSPEMEQQWRAAMQPGIDLMVSYY